MEKHQIVLMAHPDRPNPEGSPLPYVVDTFFLPAPLPPEWRVPEPRDDVPWFQETDNWKDTEPKIRTFRKRLSSHPNYFPGEPIVYDEEI